MVVAGIKPLAVLIDLVRGGGAAGGLAAASRSQNTVIACKKSNKN